MANTNIFDMLDTWNNVATTFTSVKMNVTDTASAAGSLLMDLQVGGASKFNVQKDGRTFFTDGAAGSPSIANITTPSSGLYFPAAGNMGVTLSGSERVRFAAGQGIRIVERIGWASSLSVGSDVNLERDAAATLALRNGVNAQTFNLYNTYTSATNYERLSVGWASNVCTIKAEAQTGTVRPLQIKYTPQTVATLPAAVEGAVMFVNDALDPVLGTVVVGGGTVRIPVYGTASSWICGAAGRQKESIPIAVSDETTAITAGTNKIKFRMPYAMTLTSVRASLGTAQATGLIVTVDINESGVSILSTKLTIDNTETTSVTAAVAAVISDTLLADDAEISIDIDQVGDGTAIGLKVTLIGVRT